MARAYLSLDHRLLSSLSDDALLGQLASRLPFTVERTQKSAWAYQIEHLRTLLRAFPEAHAFMEFLIPRMGRRADLVLLLRGIIFVIEYKVGACRIDRASFDQALGYGLDLKYFHETSHERRIVPLVVATKMAHAKARKYEFDNDGIMRPIGINNAELVSVLFDICNHYAGASIEPESWERGRYRPTPTIIEAAQALYRGHSVESISRSEAGAENLNQTARYITGVIEQAKRARHKAICFVTGVPGSGKTLAGLNLATERRRGHEDEHSLFLSGNGPLVDVLREALAIDAVRLARDRGKSTNKILERRHTEAFIQNIHHFRDEALRSSAPPIERVVVFDEAQRAWDREQTSKFMQQKRGRPDFSKSEPEFLLSVMDRHKDWCVIVCLVGGGQEINTGEAGIDEWLRAVAHSFPEWQVHVSPDLHFENIPQHLNHTSALHLSTSIRSFRAEFLSDFVAQVIAGNRDEARQLRKRVQGFPLYITRDLSSARRWLRMKRRGDERAGILASSNAARLRPAGIFVKAKMDPVHWFFSPHDDVRSSDALEDVGTEFETQGLELDWTCVCWDLNYRRADHHWASYQFKGTRWQQVQSEARQRFVANAYRVLLTRARQGMVLFIPYGSSDDSTRPPELYDAIFDFMAGCGFDILSE